VFDTPVEPFTPSWRAGWKGQRRYAMLTSSLADPGRFVAYGADGVITFRVEGRWRGDLSLFMARMVVDGVELIPPPPSSIARPPGQPTFPDPRTVQFCLAARLGGRDPEPDRPEAAEFR
jgi:hypothetical protein